jgi:phage tail-like protein
MTVERGEPAVGVRFLVAIDKNQLGAFNTCEGLGCEVVLEQREEGGNNGFIWQLPTRIKYGNIKLSRSICKDSDKLTAWIASFATKVTRSTASISAMTGDGEIVVTWNLDGVIPVRWTGPSLNPDSAKIATETVELAHHGFLPDRSF